MRIDQTKKNYGSLKIEFSQTLLMKSMGSSWENSTIQLGLQGLNDAELQFSTY